MVPVFSGHFSNERDAKGKLKVAAWERDGSVVPSEHRGSKGFVGFVLVDADIDCALSWTERADNKVFANHMVRTMDQPVEDWRDVADGEPWQCGATEALVLGLEPQILKNFLGPNDAGGDPFEIVVYSEEPRLGALARAELVLELRQRLMGEVGLTVGRWLASSRIRAGRGIDPTPFGLVDLHLERALGWPQVRTSEKHAGVDWMTLIEDHTGVVDARRHTVVMALDRTKGAEPVVSRITGVPFPNAIPQDVRSPPLAPVRLEAEDAYVKVFALPRSVAIHAELVARLQVRAHGAEFSSFDLNIPRVGPESTFKVMSVTTLDGVSLLSDTPMVEHDPVLGVREVDTSPKPDDIEGRVRSREKVKVNQQEDPYHDQPESRVTLVLPKPLKPGQSLVVDVQWKDVWRSGHAVGDLSLGASSGRVGVLPSLPGSPAGNPSKFRVQVLVPSESGLHSAISGQTLHSGEVGSWRIVEGGHVDTRVPFASIGVGNWQPLMGSPAAAGMPALRVSMHDRQDAAEFAHETRRQISYFHGFLPNFPWNEMELMQSPAMVNGYLWVAMHGLTELRKVKTTSAEVARRLVRVHGANLGQHVAAHELAHQWWGHYVMPAHIDDFWFSETFAESFAWMYTDAVRGTYAEGFEAKREGWEDTEALVLPRASLTDAYAGTDRGAIVYDYGPLVFQEMLRPRISHERYHGALDLLLRDHAHGSITTETIQWYFEQAGGTDLQEFFDFWVYVGHLPDEVKATWRYTEGIVHIDVESDVPFGTFDVPIRLDGRTHMISVVDGQGAIDLPQDWAPERVVLDPDGWIITGKRTVVAG
jgi:hypothetical protein